MCFIGPKLRVVGMNDVMITGTPRHFYGDSMPRIQIDGNMFMFQSAVYT